MGGPSPCLMTRWRHTRILGHRVHLHDKCTGYRLVTENESRLVRGVRAEFEYYSEMKEYTQLVLVYTNTIRLWGQFECIHLVIQR